MQKSTLYNLYMRVIDKVKRSLTQETSIELGDQTQKMQLINELEKVQFHSSKSLIIK